MNNQLSAYATQTQQRPFPLSMRSRLVLPLLLIFTALQGGQLMAAEVGDVAKSNTSNATQAEISWLSGGVGDEALAEMRKVAASFNVHVMFSDKTGHYLADIPFTVTGQDGRKILSDVSTGPLLYLKLLPGSYQIAVEIDGVWQSKRIRASASGSPVKMSFIGKAE